MYPEDRVLVGVMPHPRDLAIAQEQHWYRIPQTRMPGGIHAEYIAFYFTRAFSDDLRWGIHLYARRTGHELVRRIELLPDQPDHPRANERYYKIQLGPLKEKLPPIVSLRWRRITFIYTTWDRFISAEEINDLYSTDDQFVDRVYHALKRRGIQPDRAVQVKDGEQHYTVDMLIPCQDGAVTIAAGEDGPATALRLERNEASDLDRIESAIAARGGPILIDAGL
jgi:hypothetical protein